VFSDEAEGDGPVTVTQRHRHDVSLYNERNLALGRQ